MTTKFLYDTAAVITYEDQKEIIFLAWFILKSIYIYRMHSAKNIRHIVTNAQLKINCETKFFRIYIFGVSEMRIFLRYIFSLPLLKPQKVENAFVFDLVL